MTIAKPWTEKYRPATSNEVAGHRLSIEKLRGWLDSWAQGKQKKRAVLVYGPPGTGKTSLAEALARERGWDLVEVNASDKRNSSVLSRIAGLASTQATLSGAGRGKLVLIDEVDGINSREDQGAMPTILQIIRETRFPLILTANDPWDQKLRSLREACLLIEFKRLGLREGLPLLKTILTKEGVRASDDFLKLLIDTDRGDIRSVLNDLQILSSRARVLSIEDVALLSGRDRTESIFQVLAAIFNSKTIMSARKALDLADIDQEMLLQWILENAPYQIPVATELRSALSAIAEADMLFALIRKRQAWHLLSFALELMTAGVALAKQTPLKGWTSMRFPQRISAMSRTRAVRETRKRVGASIGARSHVSIKRAQHLYFPMIQFIYEHDPTRYEKIAGWLNAKEDLDNLVSSEVKTSETGYR